MTHPVVFPPKGYHRCHYCDRKATTKDHVIPKGRGGTNNAWNLVPSCQACNGRKADALPSCRCPVCLGAIEHHWQWLMEQPYATRQRLLFKVAPLYLDLWEPQTLRVLSETKPVT